MTNTLHRFGDADSFRDDYVVFAIASRGKNEQGALEKVREFLKLAATFGAVNLGEHLDGGALRPCKSMDPSSHWNRHLTPDLQAVIDGLDHLPTVAAVFDDRVKAQHFLKAVKE